MRTWRVLSRCGCQSGEFNFLEVRKSNFFEVFAACIEVEREGWMEEWRNTDRVSYT